MTLEERAQCIADLAAPGTARGSERQRRVYDRALKMLGELARECPACGCREVTEEELLSTLHSQ